MTTKKCNKNIRKYNEEMKNVMTSEEGAITDKKIQ